MYIQPYIYAHENIIYEVDNVCLIEYPTNRFYVKFRLPSFNIPNTKDNRINLDVKYLDILKQKKFEFPKFTEVIGFYGHYYFC